MIFAWAWMRSWARCLHTKGRDWKFPFVPVSQSARKLPVDAQFTDHCGNPVPITDVAGLVSFDRAFMFLLTSR
jgi:hypothetical protein